MDNWSGDERRKNQGFCSAHIQTVTDFAEIKQSVKNIEKGISEGVSFKTGVVTALIGIVLTIVIQIATFAFLYGQQFQQVRINTERLSVLETIARGNLSK